jgi:hypothetical protein
MSKPAACPDTQANTCFQVGYSYVDLQKMSFNEHVDKWFPVYTIKKRFFGNTMPELRLRVTKSIAPDSPAVSGSVRMHTPTSPRSIYGGRIQTARPSGMAMAAGGKGAIAASLFPTYDSFADAVVTAPSPPKMDNLPAPLLSANLEGTHNLLGPLLGNSNSNGNHTPSSRHTPPTPSSPHLPILQHSFRPTQTSTNAPHATFLGNQIPTLHQFRPVSAAGSVPTNMPCSLVYVTSDASNQSTPTDDAALVPRIGEPHTPTSLSDRQTPPPRFLENGQGFLNLQY